MIPTGLGNRLRLALGVACVIAGAVTLVSHVPRTVRSMNATERSDVLTSALDRLIKTGDTLDIPSDLQTHALAAIPPGSEYALLLPPTVTPAAEKSYGMDQFAHDVVGAWLRYLLLPSRPVADPGQARYIVCWGCDTTPWDGHTDWLWRNDKGAAIGRVQ